ncbi:EAL and HDOD domain-containing protein [Trinickia dinghuensis]|uniref:EAL domain-containing protein n=1 Tax=Trinickia dinghuensis TaxID=2291023 RepID=A0A3D8JVW5_9BURK|nr:EAL domain-containing protein [Trinickia dinghuensis]RDU97000.1 EAL domain-containing protein [Trinickia dinghuensis]
MGTATEAAQRPAEGQAEADQAGYVRYPARAPIVDGDCLLRGFELHLRELPVAEGDEADVRKATDAAAAHLLAALGASDVRTALSGHPGYLNVSRPLLFSDAIARLKPDRFFLEISPTIGVDPELTARLVTLHARRYRFVIDDLRQPDEAFAKLLPYAHAIKIDPARHDPELLQRLSKALKSAGKLLIALNVETHEAFERAKSLHFDLFQGFFFARGSKQSARRINAPRQALINLLRLLSSDPSVAQLEAELKLNPVLVMHLMRLANSGEASIGRKVATLRDAINATGTNRIARWTQLLLYADGRKVPLEEDPLVQLAATRARFMEIASSRLAATSRKVVDGAFLTGVFSLVDAVFGDTLENTLEALTLASHIRAAILHREGQLGTLLSAIESLERGDWEALDRASAALAPLTSCDLAQIAITAAAWASTADQSKENEGLERIEE